MRHRYLVTKRKLFNKLFKSKTSLGQPNSRNHLQQNNKKLHNVNTYKLVVNDNLVYQISDPCTCLLLQQFFQNLQGFLLCDHLHRNSDWLQVLIIKLQMRFLTFTLREVQTLQSHISITPFSSQYSLSEYILSNVHTDGTNINLHNNKTAMFEQD